MDSLISLFVLLLFVACFGILWLIGSAAVAVLLRLVITNARDCFRVAALSAAGTLLLFLTTVAGIEFASGDGLALWGAPLSTAQKVIICSALPAMAVFGLFAMLKAGEEFNNATDGSYKSPGAKHKNSKERESLFIGGVH